MDNQSVVTEKIPDFIMLGMMKRERGQLLSYIDELEYKIKMLEENDKSKISPSESVLRCEICIHTTEEVKRLQNALNKARKDNELLITRLCDANISRKSRYQNAIEYMGRSWDGVSTEKDIFFKALKIASGYEENYNESRKAV